MSNSNISSGEMGFRHSLSGLGKHLLLDQQKHIPQIEILGKIFSNEYFESCEVESQPSGYAKVSRGSQGIGSMKLPSFIMEVLL